MENRILQFSRIRNFYDTNPTGTSTPWGAFVESCRVPVVRGALSIDRYLVADKATRDRQKDGPAIIAGHYRKPGTRSQDDLESLAMVTLDIDESSYSFDELCDRLEGFEAVVFTSYSHTKEVPKFRAYLLLHKPITGQIKPVLERIIDYFDEHVGHLDPACRKPGQLFYAPAHPPGAAHLFQCRHISGYALDSADFPEVGPAPLPRSQPPTRPECTAMSAKPGDLFNARANWADLLEPLGWRHFYRNHWTRPGKRFGVSGSILDVGFYVHSSDPSTAPFEQGKSYTKFGALAAIYHEGDHSAAARALRTAVLVTIHK